MAKGGGGARSASGANRTGDFGGRSLSELQRVGRTGNLTGDFGGRSQEQLRTAGRILGNIQASRAARGA